MIESIERGVKQIGASATAIVLVAILWGLGRGLHRPGGRSTGRAQQMLRGRSYAVVATGFFGFCGLLWRPLPWTPGPVYRVLALAVGSLLHFSGLALALWGRLSLGQMYNVSSSLGVQLYADHRLVTHGPFAIVRHPMYLGILLATWGGLLIYRTWTTVFLAVAFLGLIVRAHREEEALAAEFGEAWDTYCQRVPPWIPRSIL